MRTLIVLLLMLVALPALAHKSSDSYLVLSARGAQLEGHWDIALRDLELVVGLDANQDGQLTWGEVRSRHEAILAYALPRLRLQGRRETCAFQAGAPEVAGHVDGIYSRIPLRATCLESLEDLQLDYGLLFERDPSHRGLASITLGDHTRSLIFGPENARQSLVGTGKRNALLDFLRQGVVHIWTGYDHLLFLLSLLLPAVLLWNGRAWEAAGDLRASGIDVLKIVTAFTLAHSITLSLAVLGLVHLPSRWVESAIALSVVLAALNNVRPLVLGRRWAVAFGFGLIHGFGFASVLAELEMPRGSLALALAGFNLGVEAGQLAVVVLFLPVIVLLRRYGFYRAIVVSAVSWGIAAIGLIWLVMRAFDLTLG